MLTKLCKQLHIPFYDAMLTWPSGSRDSDGIWATHWYASVEASTGFAPWKPKDQQVPEAFESLCQQCIELYEQLATYKMTPEGKEHASNM
jgi:hypothetical protein